MDTKTNVRNQSVELGKVTWLRDYNTALKLVNFKRNLSYFFQEIPGCSTCQNFEEMF